VSGVQHPGAGAGVRTFGDNFEGNLWQWDSSHHIVRAAARTSLQWLAITRWLVTETTLA
jgi:hypothetical protein